MAALSATGTFNTGTGTSPVSITGLGFKPRAIRFWWCGRAGTTDAVGRASQHSGDSFCTATDQRCTTAQSDDAANPSSTHQGVRDDAIIWTVDNTGADDGVAVLTSMDAGGFTITPTDAFSVDMEVHYTAWAIPNGQVTIGNTTNEPSTATTSDTTNAGFMPDVVQFIGMSAISSYTTGRQVAVDSSIFYGAAVKNPSGTISNGVVANGADNGNATATARHYCRAGTGSAGDCIARFDTTLTTTIQSYARVSAMLSTGFTLSWQAVNTGATRTYFYLAIQGLPSEIATFTTATSTGTDITLTTGFPAEGALFSGTLDTTANTAGTAASSVNHQLGCSVGTGSQNACAARDNNGQAGAVVSTCIRHSDCFAEISNGTIVGAMHTTVFGASTITCRMTTADSSIRVGWALVWGRNGADLTDVPAPFTTPDQAALPPFWPPSWLPAGDLPPVAAAPVSAFPAGGAPEEAFGAASASVLALASPAGGASEEGQAAASATITANPAGGPTEEGGGAASAGNAGVNAFPAGGRSEEGFGTSAASISAQPVGGDGEEFPGAASRINTPQVAGAAGGASEEQFGAPTATVTASPPPRSSEEAPGAP